MADDRFHTCRHCGGPVLDGDRSIAPNGIDREHADPPMGCLISLRKRMDAMQQRLNAVSQQAARADMMTRPIG
jgi:hypothetical protein